MPPVQSEHKKYWYLRIFLFLYMTMDEPLGAKPYYVVRVRIQSCPSYPNTIYLVCVARDRGDTINSKVERNGWQTSLFKEGHDEASKTTIHMQSNVVLFGKLA